MTSISQSRPFVVGVDTHARNHVYAILVPTTGALIDTRSFPVTAAGINRAIAWVARRTDADADTLWVIEGAASYGASLAGAVTAHGYTVAEAPRMSAKNRHGIGKTDALDAHRIAATTLALNEDRLRYPRADHGLRQAVRILVTAREAMTKDRTRSVNALNAVVRGNELGIDARKKLTSAQIFEIARWRSRKEELSVQVARREAVRLAKHIIDCDEQIDTNEQRLEELVQASEAAPLLPEKGFGPVSAAKCLTAWSHHGRVRNQAAFASLAGVNPIPASSGNTVRYRLNRGGDRSLNAALHMVAISRMTHDPETLQYVEKRRAEHKTDREIRRCVKRYLARRVFRILNSATGSVGLFGLAEIFLLAEKRFRYKTSEGKLSRVLPTTKDWIDTRWAILRASILGFFIGIVPGGGGTVSSIVSYGVEKRFSKNPERFGKGAIDGLAATETADNASSNSSFIPLLTLGLPPNAVLGLIFGALVMHNITPGPRLMDDNPDIFWGVIASMYIGSIFLLIINLPMIRVFVQILKVPGPILMPIVVAVAVFGVYSVNNSFFDIGLAIVFGIVGYFFKKINIGAGPLILGFVLAPMIESHWRRTLLMSNGSLAILFERPFALALIAIMVAFIGFTLIKNLRARYQQRKIN